MVTFGLGAGMVVTTFTFAPFFIGFVTGVVVAVAGLLTTQLAVVFVAGTVVLLVVGVEDTITVVADVGFLFPSDLSCVAVLEETVGVVTVALTFVVVAVSHFTFTGSAGLTPPFTLGTPAFTHTGPPLAGAGAIGTYP
jgi:hypothetical protein